MSQQAVFRKIAPSLWRDSGDPSVYGMIELDVTEIPDRSMILPLVISALNRTALQNPELTTMIRWGQIMKRDSPCISVMVNIEGAQNDLSVLNIPIEAELTAQRIREELNLKSDVVRKQTDPHLGPMLKILRYFPKWLLRPLFSIYSFLIYELDTRLGLWFLPHRPFGSVVVSNVGSLGLRKALLPLVPVARAAMMMSVGQAGPEVKALDGQICIREVIHLGITFDHRLFDGSHAAKMLRDFERGFYGGIMDLSTSATEVPKWG